MFFNERLTLVSKEACGQDLTHSLDTPVGSSIKISPEIVIQERCGGVAHDTANSRYHWQHPKKRKKWPQETRKQVSQ